MEGNGRSSPNSERRKWTRFNEALPLWKGMAAHGERIDIARPAASMRPFLYGREWLRGWRECGRTAGCFNEALPLWKGMAGVSVPTV